jgi:hypothetical protein
LDPTACLRLATRLHFMLRRHLDQEFEIGVLMQGGFEARTALRLCRTSGLPELVSLAHELERVHRHDAKANARRAAAAKEAREARKAAAVRSTKRVVAAGRAEQDLEWSKDTSGFGLSLPPAHDAAMDAELEMPAKPKPIRTGWLARLGLARRGAGT